MPEGLRRIATTATGQHGAFTKDQAHGVGFTDAQLRSRVQSGSLDRSGVRTFRSPLTPRTTLGDLTSLVLDIGEPCWISGPTAAALWGFDGFKHGRPFHVVVPRGRLLRRSGAIIHTAHSMPLIDRARLGTLPVMSATRTVIDLARTESSRAPHDGSRLCIPRWADLRGVRARANRCPSWKRALRDSPAARRH